MAALELARGPLVQQIPRQMRYISSIAELPSMRAATAIGIQPALLMSPETRVYPFMSGPLLRLQDVKLVRMADGSVTI